MVFVAVFCGVGAADVCATTDVGEYQVVIEYLEKDKNTGEYTRY